MDIAYAPMTAYYGGPKGQALDIDFRYVKTDPYVVHATIVHPDGDYLEWVISRNMLAMRNREVRGSDVAVALSVDTRWVILTLHTHDGECQLYMEAGKLGAFIADTYKVCYPTPGFVNEAAFEPPPDSPEELLSRCGD